MRISKLVKKRHYLEADRTIAGKTLDRSARISTKLDRSLIVDQHEQKQCLYVHVPKTGGCSVKTVPWVVPFAHQTATRISSQLAPERWMTTTTFSVVRNPWDRVVSLYSFFRQLSPDHRWYYGANVFVAERLKSFSTFDEFVLSLPGSPLLDALHFRPQTEFVCDVDGRLAVDHLLRSETLNADFERLCEAVGNDWVSLPHCNASSHPPFDTLYTQDAVPIVAEIYSDDVETLGYSNAAPQPA